MLDEQRQDSAEVDTTSDGGSEKELRDRRAMIECLVERTSFDDDYDMRFLPRRDEAREMSTTKLRELLINTLWKIKDSCMPWHLEFYHLEVKTNEELVQLWHKTVEWKEEAKDALQTLMLEEHYFWYMRELRESMTDTSGGTRLLL